jgi:Arc/MetJ-type ribon-helix-helix transcriptional regulator
MRITVHKPELERFVTEKVKSGEYPDPDAVVEEALVRFQGDQGDGGWTTGELREAVDVGLQQLARGEGVELKGDAELDTFIDDIKRAGRERLIQKPTSR